MSTQIAKMIQKQVVEDAATIGRENAAPSEWGGASSATTEMTKQQAKLSKLREEQVVDLLKVYFTEASHVVECRK